MRKNQRVLLSTLIISFVLFNLVYIENGQVPATSPDESGMLFFAQNTIEKNKFLWKSELNEKYNSEFFRPRGAVKYKDNLFASRTSIFYSLIVALSKLYRFEFMIVSLLGVFGVAYLFFIIRDLFDSYRTGIIGAILLSIYPPYITYSNSYFDTIPSLVFWLFSIRYYQRFLDTEMAKYLTISIVMFSMSVAIRPPMALLLVFFIPIFLLNYKKFLSKKNILLSTITIVTSIFAFLGINKVLYGSFLITGRAFIGGDLEEVSISAKLLSAIQTIDIFSYTIAFKNYLLPYQLLLIFGFLGLTLSNKKVNFNSRCFMIGFIILSLFLFLFFGGNPNLTGFHEAQIRGSLSRHFMPLGIMLIIYTSHFMSKIDVPLRKSHSVKTIAKSVMALTIVIVLINTALTGPASFHTVLDKTERVNSWNDFIKKTPEKSIFIGKSYTIYTVLDRPVFLIYDEHDLKKNPNLNRFYPILDTERDLLPLVDKLVEDGYYLYFIEMDSMKVEKILIKNGYRLKKREELPFWEVEKWK